MNASRCIVKAGFDWGLKNYHGPYNQDLKIEIQDHGNAEGYC